jgi:ATP/maltotriose-dependent transcriptional regulator MalT
MERGDHDEARRLAERAVALMSDLEDNRVATMASVRLAVTRRQMGDPAAILEPLLRAAGGWDLTKVQPSWRVHYAAALAHAELRHGGADAADAFAASAERAADGLGLTVATAVARRARAAVLLAAGDAKTAAELAMASADTAATARAVIEAARSHALAGQALAAAGERTRAVQLLRSAEKAFDSCGAERDRQEARHQLRRLGAKSEPRGPGVRPEEDGVGSLTRRELEIAQLVTARKTNREMAAELFLSEKTIETHLRNIFFKLSVSSRVQVARVVEAADGLASGRIDS